MNLTAIGLTGQSVMFKFALAEGARVFDYTVFRNVSVIIIAAIQLSCAGLNPVKTFPWADKKQILLGRIIAGQSNFVLFNYTLNFVPLTLMMIIFRTNSFWTSILAYCFFNEKMTLLEIIAMLLCFGSMVTITVTRDASESQDELA